MRVKVFLFGTLLMVFSCKNLETTKCDGELELEAFKTALFNEFTSEIKSDFYSGLGMENMTEYTKEFFKNYVKIDLIRTTNLDKELNRCNCSARVNILPVTRDINTELLPKMYDAQIGVYLMGASLRKDVQMVSNESGLTFRTFNDVSLNLNYVVQKIESGELIIEYNDNLELLSTILVMHYWDDKLNR